MKPRPIRFILFLLCALSCLAVSAGLAIQQVGIYRETLTILPPGTSIAGIPAGGLTLEESAKRIAEALPLTPVEIVIQPGANDQGFTSSRVQIEPLSAGLVLDLSDMIEQARQAYARTRFWNGFWNFLWNHSPASVEIPLSCSVDENQLNQYLHDLLLPRYERPATRAQPVPGDVTFTPGQPGQTLDIEGAIPKIHQALCSLTERTVEIQTIQTPALPPDPVLLQPMLDALIQGSEFDGIIELYYQDLQSGSEFTTAFNHGQPVETGIAFTAASTIKIPVMVSVYRQLDGTLPDDLRQQMEQMIDLSDNSSTDEVMQRVLDANLAPLQVSEDAQALNLKNTFLAGFFYQGAPLLDLFKTPANQRSDISTDPDVYNQTSAEDMGHLLAAIQNCAANGTGQLITTFSGQVSQAECQDMINLLLKNKKGVLIEAGLPEGTQMARKYGWVTDPADGLMHSTSDATLVFTPGGNFVLTVYLYHPEQLQWDPAQRLVARLATAVNNYHNQWK
jgi:beta-lactamase class A